MGGSTEANHVRNEHFIDDLPSELLVADLPEYFPASIDVTGPFVAVDDGRIRNNIWLNSRVLHFVEDLLGVGWVPHFGQAQNNAVVPELRGWQVILLDGLLVQLLHHVEVLHSSEVDHQLVVGRVGGLNVHGFHPPECFQGVICLVLRGQNGQVEVEVLLGVVSLVEEALERSVHVPHELVGSPLAEMGGGAILGIVEDLQGLVCFVDIGG
mmetsp:Transcript_33326/g.51074  ORF Transcript_33326/g.51074 Transcript_33326/m.51074 type:complete len:211 (-) Transcript_33326:148-780(-)